VEGFFAPPPARREREVPAADLARTIAALADFALEKVQ
jgi:hypothetical protein